ncbi:hypothetical protein [Desulfosarcina cetonica]|uniref:hypothetical protein n=1 Tax=Desulfosarcina cetonica TaxID=90730 RepID=UPI00155DAACF|nr:hypothetical protein [Desulfosarcina cetonica]
MLYGCAHQPVDAVSKTSQPPIETTSGRDQPLIAPSPRHDDESGSSERSACENLSGDLQPDDADTEDTGAEEEDDAPLHSTQHELDDALDYCDAAQDYWQKGELESALEALDKAYALILSVRPDSPDKIIQQKEDLRFLISKRILEIYASRNIVVNGNHNEIPRYLNAKVQKEIDLFNGPEKKFFIEAYRRSGKYRPSSSVNWKPPGCQRNCRGCPDRKRFQGPCPVSRPGLGTLAIHSVHGI